VASLSVMALCFSCSSSISCVEQSAVSHDQNLR
jgi:hypothetical protein